MQPDVEPDRRIESAMLVHAKPGQLIVKSLGLFRIGEISVGDAPVGDCARDAMHELAHGRFTPTFVRIRAVGDVAIKILGDGDFRRESAPGFRHLDVFLLENHLAAVVRDLGRAPFPIDLVERCDVCVAENALETQTFALLFASAIFATNGRFPWAIERGRVNPGFELDHGGAAVKVANRRE